MTARRLILLVGAIALIAGIVALLMPVSVSGPAGSASCGTPIAGGDLSDAQAKDNNAGNAVGNIPVVGPLVQSMAPQSQTHYVADCNSGIDTRLWWAIPLAVVGAVGIAGSLTMRGGRAVGARPEL
jgi:hypothetical protein